MNFLQRLFGKKEKAAPLPDDAFTEAQFEMDYEAKQQGLEAILGTMQDMVGHAIIPFSIGSAVDMYYFTNHIPGTGFATMELLDPDGNGPKPNKLGTYELVAFTKEPYNEHDSEPTAFNKAERNICDIFTTIGNYSFQAVLNPKETCEIPMDGAPNKCLVFDHYNPGKANFRVGERQHHLLLIMEVLKEEMEFARANGSDALFELLRQNGYYPYSDLDRPAVV